MREPGYYWVRVTEPVCDGGGVVDEVTGPPEIARWEDLRWYRMGMEGPVADQYDVHVLYPELRVPPPPDAQASIELLRFAVAVNGELGEDEATYGSWEFGDLERAMVAIHRAFGERLSFLLKAIKW
jgi:hypothetical protein